ncbi:methyl-accepting chemotaxis protein [Cohnella lupini]|uniref:Methyl-accepting chemotaxis protein (MCP) signaling protein n=1 Tax=Cohnella lupini TaxID=1294267 RepID=A0A3D9I3J8_9BACL|nr:methyl-accepting chemotaxis protein [Cohnella lupini]RED55726.1 methyl-accepting chemotaxis protein (MCP) signaling protein [Cohnella lupini]
MNNNVKSLESLVTLLPIIQAAVPADMSIAVCDRTQFIAYYPGENINLGIGVGHKLNPEEPLVIAMTENTFFRGDVPAEFYGFEFTGTALPVHDDQGIVIGGVAVQIRRHSELIELANQIVVALSQANDKIVQAVSGSNAIADLNRRLLVLSQEGGQSVEKTNQVVSVIKNVADQSNLLGLNASIEAAHAGDKGRGFGIVAGEIRKLSLETIASTKDIRQTLQELKEVTHQIGEAINQVASISKEQAVSTEQISAFIKEIQEMTGHLNDFARKL